MDIYPLKFEDITFLHIVDQWSLGVLCFVLLSGIFPFGDDDIQVTMENVTRLHLTITFH